MEGRSENDTLFAIILNQEANEFNCNRIIANVRVTQFPPNLQV